MIQLNLLPNVKLEYVKAKRNKRMTITIAGVITAVLLVIFIALFVSVQIVQKNYSKDLSKDIKTESSKLEGTKDLNKILTIQNQLNNLTELHDQKPVSTRLFDYLKQITPAKVSIASVALDYDAKTISLSGAADSVVSINKFVDTLKFATFKAGDDKSGQAFNSVVLASFGRDDKGASYSVSMNFDSVIFDSKYNVTITVPPNKITTRSETEKPDALFQPLSDTKENN